MAENMKGVIFFGPNMASIVKCAVFIEKSLSERIKC